jgi:hypothetical protein
VVVEPADCGRSVGAMSQHLASLPYVDEHAVTIEANRDVSWVALQHMLESAAPAWFSRVLGCIDTAASGPRPMEEGSTVPGFRVVAADAPHELSLAGRHHFSDYALIFRLDELSEGRTRLRAESRAVFLGFRGGPYRMLLMGTGGHVLATRRMLAAVKRAAERFIADADGEGAEAS